MPASAWLMFLFGAGVLYGGLAWCLWVAWRHRHDGRRDESAPLDD